MASALPAFTALSFKAFEGGCEVTLDELMNAISFDSDNVLDRVVELDEFLSESELELRPSIREGGPADVRVLAYARQKRGVADCLKDAIAVGEDAKVEFKSTAYVSLRRVRLGEEPNDCWDEGVVNSALKTICGYLNKDGGDLYIGVEPDGKLCGIEVDFPVLSSRHRDFDGWVNRFQDLIKSRFHESKLVANYIDYDVERIDGSLIVKISVKSKRRVSFVKDANGAFHCYVRYSARTEEVTIENMPDFLSSRAQ